VFLPLWYHNFVIEIQEVRIMAKCEVCGKGPMFGHNVSHSKRATNRMFRPNIQRKRLMIDGKMRRVQICTRCLRTMSRASK
jgi:large subunit ribosomal protein L28